MSARLFAIKSRLACYLPNLFLIYPGAEVEKVNLGPLLYKRLKIQGTTLRSRSVEYQTDIISRQALMNRTWVPYINSRYLFQLQE